MPALLQDGLGVVTCDVSRESEGELRMRLELISYRAGPVMGISLANRLTDPRIIGDEGHVGQALDAPDAGETCHNKREQAREEVPIAGPRGSKRDERKSEGCIGCEE